MNVLIARNKGMKIRFGRGLDFTFIKWISPKNLKRIKSQMFFFYEESVVQVLKAYGKLSGHYGEKIYGIWLPKNILRTYKNIISLNHSAIRLDNPARDHIPDIQPDSRIWIFFKKPDIRPNHYPVFP